MLSSDAHISLSLSLRIYKGLVQTGAGARRALWRCVWWRRRWVRYDMVTNNQQLWAAGQIYASLSLETLKRNQGKFSAVKKDIMRRENTAWGNDAFMIRSAAYVPHRLIVSWHLLFAIEILCLAIHMEAEDNVYRWCWMNHLHYGRHLLTMAFVLRMMMAVIMMCSCSSFISGRVLLWYSSAGFNGQFLELSTFPLRKTRLKCQDTERCFSLVIKTELPFLLWCFQRAAVMKNNLQWIRATIRGVCQALGWASDGKRLLFSLSF